MTTRWRRRAVYGLTALGATACGAPEESSRAELGTSTEAIWNGSNDCDPDPNDPTGCVEGSLGVSEEQRRRNGVVRVRVVDKGSCTGTFLTPELVLTAAHCVDEYMPGDTIEIIANHVYDALYQRVEARVPPHLAAGAPFVVRGSEPRADVTTDLALVFLDTPENTIQTIAGKFPNEPLYTLPQILEFGYPVTLREEPLTSGQHDVELVGFGTVNRPNVGTKESPEYRQTSGILPDFEFEYWNRGTFPQKAIRKWFDWNPFVGIDAGDSGGPLFVVNADGSRSQAGVAKSGCAPNRPIAEPLGGLNAPDCVAQACPGGYIDTQGNCTANAPLCNLNPGGTPVPGIAADGVNCGIIVPSKKAYVNQNPCGAPQGNNWVFGFTNPNDPSVCDAVDPLQQCDANGNPVVGDLCQTLEPPKAVWVDVTDDDASDWILTNGADPNRPGRLYGERDYAGTCRSNVDADCDRNFDPLPNDCPVIFDAGNNFNPDLSISTLRPAVYGRQYVDIHDRAVLYGVGTFGHIAAGTTRSRAAVVVRNDATVGSIYGGDIYGFGWRSTVASVLASTCDNNDCIRAEGGFGGIWSLGARIPDIRLSASFGDYDVEDVHTTPHGVFVCNTESHCPIYPIATVNMASDRYWKSVSVHAGSALRLTAGKHYFDQLLLYKDSKLIVDHRGGAVEIFVRNDLFWQGTVEQNPNDLTGRRGATVLAYFGNADVTLYSSFTGTVVAPNATLELHDNQQQYYGQFIANRVVVRPDVIVNTLTCDQ